MATKILDANSVSGSVSSDIVHIKSKGTAIQTVIKNAVDLVAHVELQSTVNGTEWDTIEDSEKELSGNGSESWNVDGAYYKKIKVKLVITQGTCDVEAFVETKEG